ncbi:MAG: hypothetical protein RLZZ44_1914, partial [Bacteroidota bacterium]
PISANAITTNMEVKIFIVNILIKDKNTKK